MQVINYTEFRNNLAENLNIVNEETLRLVSSKTNQERLDEAIEEMRSGKSAKHELIED